SLTAAVAALYDVIGAASAAVGAASPMRRAGASVDRSTDAFPIAALARYSAGATARISDAAAAGAEGSAAASTADTIAAVVVVRRQNIGCSRFTRSPANRGDRAPLEWRPPTKFNSQRRGGDPTRGPPPPETAPPGTAD